MTWLCIIEYLLSKLDAKMRGERAEKLICLLQQKKIERKERKEKKNKGKVRKNQEKSKETKEKPKAAKERGRPAAKGRKKKRRSCRGRKRKWWSSHRAQPRAAAVAVVPLRRR